MTTPAHDGGTVSTTDNILAAEYVLGLLDADQSAVAERRCTLDAAFARAVETWRVRFAEFDRSVETPAVGQRLWRRIDSALPTTPDAPRAARPRFLTTLWNSLPAWRMAALSAMAATLVLAIGLAAAVREARRTPVFVAILVKEGTGQPGAVVNAFADGRTELIPLESVDVPPGRALEIWTLWDRSVGPRSIGLIDQARTTRLNVEKLPRTGPNQLFEITLEPAAGSPVGRPTGPILYKGTTSPTL